MANVLVVKRNELFKEHYFEGFLPLEERDYIAIILNSYSYMERNNELENNPEYIQIIPYVWVINSQLKKVFIYQRDLGNNYKERRHINRYSGGVGGHIDEEEYELNPIAHAANRELREELVMLSYPSVRFIGYMNDDSDIYNKVHFGIVGLVETTENIRITNDGLKNGSFYSVDEIENFFNNLDNEIESWTKLSWPHVRKYLNDNFKK